MEPRFTSFLANRGSVVSGLRYTTPGAGDAAKAGLMDASGHLPADVPSNWQIYFAVEDADATIEKAVSLGAAVIDGPDDSPFGRLATLADPTGAMFKIVADNVLVANAVQSPEA